MRTIAPPPDRNSVAQKAKKVYGVEIVAPAIDDARNNAKINGIENAEFFVGKAEEVLPEYLPSATWITSSGTAFSTAFQIFFNVVYWNYYAYFYHYFSSEQP